MAACCPVFVQRLRWSLRQEFTSARAHQEESHHENSYRGGTGSFGYGGANSINSLGMQGAKKFSTRILWSRIPETARDQGRRIHNNDAAAWRHSAIGVASHASIDRPPVVEDVSVQALDVPLLAPFTIASTVVESVRNVAVRVRLDTGHCGWGEIPTMPPITAEDQSFALAVARRVAEWLPGRAVDPWQAILSDLAVHIPGHQYAAVRAGFEMAVLDALARSREEPLWRFFGGTSNEVTTDITIPICSPQEATALAFKYKQQGFHTIKTKVGKEPKDDIICLKAIRFAHPECRLILDANEGYTPEEALDVLRLLREAGIRLTLLEQPVPRDDWQGLKKVKEESNRLYGVPVAADESCRSPADARRIAEDGSADVLNIKFAKCGVAGALEIVAVAKEHDLELMMGGMVETRLAMGFAAHFVAGVGGFSYVDLDTPLLLAHDPVQGGYTATGPRYRLGNAAGHGASLEVQ